MKKSSLILISISIALCAFVAGFGFHLFPERTLHLLMPIETDLYLKSKYYTVWYYPEWFEKSTDVTGKSRYLKSTPSITLKSQTGKAIELTGLPDSPKYPSYVRSGSQVAIPLGQLLIPNPGKYHLVGKSKENKSFVIAFVPSNAETDITKLHNTLHFQGMFSRKLDNSSF